MCGIVGYVGPRNAVDVLIGGLHSLEYRGYDSAGIAVMDESREFSIVKGVGKVSDLQSLLSGKSLSANEGIGHTRWATHGGVTEVNAHPHSDLSSRIVLVHNGIVENYREIRDELAREGHRGFKSETDTEIIAELLAVLYKNDMVQALVELHARLRGSFALAIMAKDAPDKIYCLRKGSPLVVGVSRSGEG
ncbi:MAG TPA: glutamine--fructose-6-phosphate aminotransferase, partial [Synergistaceae bacterium]|nr:glutamine--fructose-6-phosphate aminotransferase [Synergistaceae bacterium]